MSRHCVHRGLSNKNRKTVLKFLKFWRFSQILSMVENPLTKASKSAFFGLIFYFYWAIPQFPEYCFSYFLYDRISILENNKRGNYVKENIRFSGVRLFLLLWYES
jgi:hypothetical protein